MSTASIVILAIAAIVGFRKGAIKMGAHFAGTIVGMVLAYLYYKEVGEFIAPYIGTEGKTSSILAFPIIALAVPIGFGVLGTFLTKVVSIVHLGLINRLLGAAISVVCYGAILMFVKFIMNLLTNV